MHENQTWNSLNYVIFKFSCASTLNFNKYPVTYNGLALKALLVSIGIIIVNVSRPYTLKLNKLPLNCKGSITEDGVLPSYNCDINWCKSMQTQQYGKASKALMSLYVNVKFSRAYVANHNKLLLICKSNGHSCKVLRT